MPNGGSRSQSSPSKTSIRFVQEVGVLYMHVQGADSEDRARP